MSGALVAALLAAASPGPSAAEQEVIATQRALIAAVERSDRQALESGIDEGFILHFILRDGDRQRWGTTNKERVIKRWTGDKTGVLPTIVSHQQAIVRGETATVFACITDRMRKDDGTEERVFSRVSDTLSKRDGRWLWIASMEVQVADCEAR